MVFREASYKGTYLTLQIGSGKPSPAPRVVLDALQSIQVTNSKERSGFQLTFAVGKNSPLINEMLPDGYFDPIITRVIITVTLNGIVNVLMDGLITNQEFTPSNEPGQSSLTITGEDLSLAMDLVELRRPWPGMSEVAVVNAILAPYASLGIVPLVIPPFIPNLRNPIEGFDAQDSTDRAYIKGLARSSGFVFFVQPGPTPGKSIAYFGPDVNVPIPQSAVSINMDAHSNAESMSFSLDGLAKQVKFFIIFDPITGKLAIPIPVPNINAFKPPLGKRITPPARFSSSEISAPMSPLSASQLILGFMMDSANASAVSGTGSIDVTRYNQILRARMLVAIRGASLAYDGYYYVDSVTHNIKKGEYKQSFSISRDGLISLTSTVNA